MKLKVTYFQRRPRTGFNFSMENIFIDVREKLQNHMAATVKICSFYNNGFVSILLNTVEAFFRQRKNRVVHITGEVHFLNALMRRNKVVLTILDCGMMYRKTGIQQKIVNLIYLKWPVQKATIITAISNETKKDIISFTGNKNADIRVIPVAIDAIFQAVPKKFSKKNPIILQIGTGPNKNLIRLIEALEGIDCKLHIVGRLSEDQIATLKTHKIDYHNCYNLTQKEVLEQYVLCDILSFVSTREGFGMPIVEANAVERVVVTSNLSSMPEIAGNAACLVNPNETNSIRNGFLKVIQDDAYRQELIVNGRENKKRFNAAKIALDYLKIYKELTAN
jgi:glycosyltransferase involved in cell wall biosynthesis